MTHRAAPAPADAILPPEVLAILKQCRACKATCCTYISVPLDVPEDEDDYEAIRWYLTRRETEVYIDDEGSWYLQVNQRCVHLQDDYRCGAYENRPKVCADHDPKNCEYWEKPVFERHWRTMEEFDAYYATVKAQWAKKAEARRRNARKAAKARWAAAKARAPPRGKGRTTKPI